MSICVHRQTELTSEKISSLGRALVDYYAKPPNSYYEIADQKAAHYEPRLTPFHCDLVSRVRPGFSVVEVGCGSAHLCQSVEDAGASYTGIDHSRELLEQNRVRFPKARFLSVQTTLQETFDIVASLYTIEHVIDPALYLETLWNLCRPDGMVAIICPDFVDGDGLPPSFYYGKTPRRFRDKLASLDLGDVIKHLFDLRWFAPRWKRRARLSAPGAFWINLAPRIFVGAEYSIDADAVHLPRLADLIWWFEKRAATIVESSLSLSIPDKSVLNHNCYVLARKAT